MELLVEAKARVVDNSEKQGFLAALSAAVFLECLHISSCASYLRPAERMIGLLRTTCCVGERAVLRHFGRVWDDIKSREIRDRVGFSSSVARYPSVFADNSLLRRGPRSPFNLAHLVVGNGMGHESVFGPPCHRHFHFNRRK